MITKESYRLILEWHCLHLESRRVILVFASAQPRREEALPGDIDAFPGVANSQVEDHHPGAREITN
jgi:hypothetical protein